MIKIIKQLPGRDKLIALLCLALVAGQVWLDIELPDFMAEVVQKLASTEENLTGDILVSGMWMLLCAAGSVALSITVGYLAARIAANFSYTVRASLFNKISDFGTAEMKHFSPASLITRTTNDITQIQMVISMGLQVMVKAPITAVWAVVRILGKSTSLSIVVAVAVLILAITITTVMRFVIPKFRIIQRQVDDVNRVIDESLTGLKVVRAFNADEYQQNKFERVNLNLTATNLFTMRTMSFMGPIIGLVMSSIQLVIYYIGAIIVNGINLGDTSPTGELINTVKVLKDTRADFFADLVVFGSYAMMVVMSFMMLTMIFMILPRAQVSAKRIREVLDEEISVQSGNAYVPNDKEIEGAVESAADPIGTIEFKNVSFHFPGSNENFMKNLNFQVTQGQTLAIIGSTGSGKSTLLNLAARLYDATEGEVLIDGHNVKDYPFEVLYKKVGLIPQKATLFADTIRDNVTFGDRHAKISEEDVMAALDIAQATEFVMKKEGGLDFMVSQGGSNISGGQKQRLAIARAIAKKPEILLFDDSFSALDFKTDRLLRKEIAEKLKDTTCVIVASRIGTIKNADCILVLADGEIVGKGTHRELLKSCDVYREIAQSQLTEAELEA
ncbi:MAG: ABC transporter ATP-binding protein [Lachnospiraceae bacterium]|nr:ABC transporter ATP-binding protein [Lachnospiraceae bacterium]